MTEGIAGQTLVALAARILTLVESVAHINSTYSVGSNWMMKFHAATVLAALP
jgi:hypothetical protein